MKALDKQIGADYYKNVAIQPYEFFIANKVPHHKAAIIRRIWRYDLPGGKGIIDLKKIVHECDLILELQEITFWTRFKESWKQRFDKIQLWDFLDQNLMPIQKARVIKAIYQYDAFIGIGRVEISIIKSIARGLIKEMEE